MNQTRRHSSLEPNEVVHIHSEAGEYALVTKLPAKKKHADKEVSSLLSSTVKAQLTLDTTEQIGKWEPEEEEKHEKPGYVRLDFHAQNSYSPKSPRPSNIVDTGKTKFAYSTVVFDAEPKAIDKEFAERKRQNKPAPLPPPRYEGSRSALPKHSSDSRLLYSDINFNKSNPPVTTKGTSSPDLAQSTDSSDTSPYVNVRHNGAPIVPPRRGVASPIAEQSPPIPVRKIS